MATIAELKAELVAGHPDTGVYNIDDALAAAELNVVNRPGRVDINTIHRFMALEEVHSTDGSDTQDRSLWQRLQEVVNLAATPTGGLSNPWGSTTLGNVSEIQQIKCHQLLAFFTLAVQGQSQIDLTNTNFKSFLGGAQSAGVMSTAQETALLAIAFNTANQQSRGVEIGWGSVGDGDVTEARALP